MNTLGIYIYNSDRNEWLQEDEMEWGPFTDAREWHEGEEEIAESVRLAVTPGTDTTFVMAALH